MGCLAQLADRVGSLIIFWMFRRTWRGLIAARGDSKYTEDIEKDLHRNFPTHELFGGEFEKIGE